MGTTWEEETKGKRTSALTAEVRFGGITILVCEFVIRNS